MKLKLNYKVNKNFDLNKLSNYGFYKTQPKNNPWWQCPLTTDWSSGLGFYIESLSIHKDTMEVFLDIDDNCKSEKYVALISELIKDNVLIVN